MNRDFAQLEWSSQIEEDLRRIVRLAVFEELERGHDWTTISLVPEDSKASAHVAARVPGVIAGLRAVPTIFDEMEMEAEFHPLITDGDAVMAGAALAKLAGSARDLLTSERIVLNVIGHLSGIATLTRKYVEAVAGTRAQIYDTRKTIPAWRRLEKYAVHAGGGRNHRTGLYDGILIKDNHLALGREENGDRAFTPAAAVRLARNFLQQQAADDSPPGGPNPNLIVEIEVDSLEQLSDVLPEQPDIVLLDNMSPEALRQAVQIRDRGNYSSQLEASGGVNLQTVRAIAETGVERISVGALTHSATNLDVGLDWL